MIYSIRVRFMPDELDVLKAGFAQWPLVVTGRGWKCPLPPGRLMPPDEITAFIAGTVTTKNAIPIERLDVAHALLSAIFDALVDAQKRLQKASDAEVSALAAQKLPDRHDQDTATLRTALSDYYSDQGSLAVEALDLIEAIRVDCGSITRQIKMINPGQF